MTAAAEARFRQSKSSAIPALLPLLLVLAVPARAEDYEVVFGARYRDAVSYVTDRMGVWSAALQRLGAHPRTLVPVVFPEVLKFALFRDDVETLGLETLYVARGTELADFSIGRFQMKPSFVEALESWMRAHGDVPEGLAAIAEFPEHASLPEIRAERVRRLRDPSWQLVYLAGFERAAAGRAPAGEGSDVELVRFLAASYNRGFWRAVSDIVASESWRLFPRGLTGYPGPYSYVDIVVDFYERIWRPLYDFRFGS